MRTRIWAMGMREGLRGCERNSITSVVLVRDETLRSLRDAIAQGLMALQAKHCTIDEHA